ncbi:MAG: hypothetical protein FWH56_11215 [Betaproteobacteria bacterium]|nr:hypothetical protein [Betaproteobacteria bacterium]
MRGQGRRIARHAEVIANTGLMDTQLWPERRTPGRIRSLIRKLTLNMLKLDTAHPKKGVRLRRKSAAWDDDRRRVPEMKLS